ncbi:hypothetical protein [Candidatus Lokiarchaeum ossiferum]
MIHRIQEVQELNILQCIKFLGKPNFRKDMHITQTHTYRRYIDRKINSDLRHLTLLDQRRLTESEMP